VKVPIGYLPKSISIENENEVVWMYREVIDVAEVNPFVKFTLNTLLQLFWQSVAEFIKAKGR
jgi:hypothetical protein